MEPRTGFALFIAYLLCTIHNSPSALDHQRKQSPPHMVTMVVRTIRGNCLKYSWMVPCLQEPGLYFSNKQLHLLCGLENVQNS